MIIRKLLIVTTFFSLWLTSYIPEYVQYSIALFFIFTVGILHGSNDISIIQKLRTPNEKSVILYPLLVYVSVVGIATLLFYFLPILALVLFLIFSAYHFGEQQYHSSLMPTIIIKKIMYVAYGSLVIFMLLSLNKEEVLTITSKMAAVQISPTIYGICIGVSFLLYLSIISYGYVKKQLDVNFISYELLLLAVFAIVFQISNLLWSFAIYFILWHSIPSIIEQLAYLHKEISMASFLKYIKSSFTIWLISIAAIGAFLYYFKDNSAIFLPILFSFLGAITFAHSFVISKMFKKKPPTQ